MRYNCPKEISGTGIFITAIILLLIFASQSASAVSNDSDEYEILYINSYHQGHDWSDNIAKGVTDYFKDDNDVKIFTEYMDTKQYPQEAHLENLYSLYFEKYKNRQFDAIITSDDNALFFVLKHQKNLFQDTPVIFCGVNEVPADFQEKYPKVTGILESLPIKETIDTAIKVNPKPLKEIYIITDTTETGLSYRILTDDIIQNYPQVRFTQIYNITMNQLSYDVKNLPKDLAIIYIAFNRDSEGNTFTNKEAVNQISKNSDVPIYTMTDYLLYSDVAGGIVVSSYDHGYQASEIAHEVIRGRNPSDIAIEKDSKYYPAFNYETLEEFNFDTSKLPENSIIVNKPEESVEIPIITYLIILTAFVLLFLLSVLLVIYNRRLKITGELLKSSEDRLSMAILATKDGILDWNSKENQIYLNKAGLEILGYKAKDTIISPERWTESIHPDDIKGAMELFRRFKENQGNFTTEYRVKTRKGDYKWIRARAKSFESTDGKTTRIIGTFTDIDETVRYKNALLEANKKLSILSSVTRHDILNQATALLGYIEIMKDMFADNKDISSFIPKLTRSVETIQQQINFSKDYEEMGNTEPKWQNVSDVAKRAAVSAGDEKIKISVDTGNVEIFADHMLQKVFYNLFDNTKRHGEDATQINVTFKKTINKTGIIIVEDNGKGIEPSKKEYVFEKGFGGNSGYGLFLIKNILEITGIKIKETGIYQKGAKFEIIVPENLWYIPTDINDLDINEFVK